MAKLALSQITVTINLDTFLRHGGEVCSTVTGYDVDVDGAFVMGANLQGEFSANLAGVNINTLVILDEVNRVLDLMMRAPERQGE